MEEKIFDLEKYEGESRASGLSSEQYTDCAIAFMDTIKAAGYMPMIYGNLNTFFLMLDLNRLENYEIEAAAGLSEEESVKTIDRIAERYGIFGERLTRSYLEIVLEERK